MYRAFNTSRPKRKLIITLVNEKINIYSKSFSITFNSEFIDELKRSSSLRRKTVSYKVFIDNKEKQLICPMLKSDDKKNIVICPSIKLPNRKYPVYVYIYAVILYLSSGLSMRKVALKVRTKFGLENFSHSTLSRVLNKLYLNAEEIAMLSDSDDFEAPQTAIKTRPCWKETQLEKYQLLHKTLSQILDPDKYMDFSSLLSYQFYERYHKYLI